MDAVLYETHMHTPLCGHAEGEPEDYAKAAAERGLKGIIVTDHNPMPNGYGTESRMTVFQFPYYLRKVQRARDLMAGTIDVRLGLECDYFPGVEPWLRSQLASAPFDYVLGSVHPHIPEYRAMFWTGSMLAYQRTYFEHLASAAESGLFDALAHPDLIKNEAGGAWDLGAVLPFVRESLDRVAATGCALELNTSGLNKKVPEMNPSTTILAEALERSIPIVIGADAHTPARVGDNYVKALTTLQEVGYQNVNVFFERSREEVAIAAALSTVR